MDAASSKRECPLDIRRMIMEYYTDNVIHSKSDSELCSVREERVSTGNPGVRGQRGLLISVHFDDSIYAMQPLNDMHTAFDDEDGCLVNLRKAFRKLNKPLKGREESLVDHKGRQSLCVSYDGRSRKMQARVCPWDIGRSREAPTDSLQQAAMCLGATEARKDALWQIVIVALKRSVSHVCENYYSQVSCI